MKKEIRDFNRYRTNVTEDFIRQVDDYIAKNPYRGEISFETPLNSFQNAKLTYLDQQNFFQLILTSSGRIKNSFPQKGVLAWILLNRLTDSSIYIFDSKSDYKNFFSVKQENYIANNHEDFNIEKIAKDTLPFSYQLLLNDCTDKPLFNHNLLKITRFYYDYNSQVPELFYDYMLLVGDYSKVWIP